MKFPTSFIALAVLLGLPAIAAEMENEVTLEIPSTKEHPRNSEGAFATLKSGRIIFYYAQFSGGDTDFSTDSVVEIHSDDQGRTWSGPRTVFERGESLSLMCLNLLRLDDGRLAFLYDLKKGYQDCRPCIRFSTDEAQTWSEPHYLTGVPGYYGINNDRLIQTSTGRLIVPIDWDRLRSAANTAAALDERGLTVWYLSDDRGATWHEAKNWWGLPVPSENGLQEPGVVELADHSLYSWARTDVGTQFQFRSRDGGETWSGPRPSDLVSTLGPASIKRFPNSNALLAIFNDRTALPIVHDGGRSHRFVRTPLTAAVSLNGAESWPFRRNIETDPDREFCYTAIHFVDRAVLLAYSAGDPSLAHLGTIRIRRISLSWFPGINPPRRGAPAEEPSSTVKPDNTRYYVSPDLLPPCAERVAAIQHRPCRIIFIGDSITAGWLTQASWLWTTRYAERGALDFGIGGDKTQNVIWRLGHMDLSGLHPRVAVIMIGTNNTRNTPGEIAQGVEAVVAKTREAFPGIHVILVSILPNLRANAKMMAADALLRRYAEGSNVHYLDLVPLMPPVGDNWKGLLPDHLHPDRSGYEIWADAMEPLLGRLLQDH